MENKRKRVKVCACVAPISSWQTTVVMKPSETLQRVSSAIAGVAYPTHLITLPTLLLLLYFCIHSELLIYSADRHAVPAPSECPVSTILYPLSTRI